MSQSRAQILTPWGSDALGRNVPQLALDYAVLDWFDATGQPAAVIPPTPNLFTVQCVLDDAVLATVDADPNYAVLWSEPL